MNLQKGTFKNFHKASVPAVFGSTSYPASPPLPQPSVRSASFSEHMLKPRLQAGLSERAGRLQHGLAHRVPQLLEEHPKEQQHEGEESEQHPDIQRQVPAPAQSQGQRGGRHHEPLGSRHGVEVEERWSFPSLGSSQGLQVACPCSRNHGLNAYPAGLAAIEFPFAGMVFNPHAGQVRTC